MKNIKSIFLEGFMKRVKEIWAKFRSFLKRALCVSIIVLVAMQVVAVRYQNAAAEADQAGFDRGMMIAAQIAGGQISYNANEDKTVFFVLKDLGTKRIDGGAYRYQVMATSSFSPLKIGDICEAGNGPKQLWTEFCEKYPDYEKRRYPPFKRD
jgi:hypothetical protein